MLTLLTPRWLSRSALSLLLALGLAPGCASVTVDDDEGTRDDDMMGDGDGDLGSGGAASTGGRAGTGGRSGSGGALGSGGGDLVGDSGGASSGGMGSDSGGSSSGGSSSGGSSSGGASSGGAGSGGAGSGGAAPSGDMCDAALWASGPQGTYEDGDHVTAVCDDSGLQNGHECYGYDGLHWFYCEGDSYQCSTYDPSGNVAHGVWQIDPTPCP